jgi:hypothetical protein
MTSAKQKDQSAKPPKPKKTKKEMRKLYLRFFYGFIFFITAGVEYLLQPFQATIHYGICRTFVELQLRFPQTLYVSSLEVYERTWRMYYTYTGSSGEQRASMIECRFTTNPKTGYPWLESIVIDRIPIAKDKIQQFNRLIPVVVAAKPDITDPGTLTDKDIIDLQVDWQYHDWEEHQ